MLHRFKEIYVLKDPNIPQGLRGPNAQWTRPTNPMIGQRNFTKSHNIIVMWHFNENPTPPPAALLMYGIA